VSGVNEVYHDPSCRPPLPHLCRRFLLLIDSTPRIKGVSAMGGIAVLDLGPLPAALFPDNQKLLCTKISDMTLEAVNRVDNRGYC
jgi:hypothetical protein